MNPEQQDEAGWKADANCVGKPQHVFFPGSGPTENEIQRIRNVCAPCKVRTECLEYALAHNENFGWWGGLSERERKRLKKKRKQGRPRRDIDNARALLDEIQKREPWTWYDGIHGERSTYTVGGCRCDECTAAEREYRRKWRAKK